MAISHAIKDVTHSRSTPIFFYGILHCKSVLLHRYQQSKSLCASPSLPPSSSPVIRTLSLIITLSTKLIQHPPLSFLEWHWYWREGTPGYRHNCRSPWLLLSHHYFSQWRPRPPPQPPGTRLPRPDHPRRR